MLVHMYQNTSGPDETQVLIAHGREIETKSLGDWQDAVRRSAGQMPQRLAFMTPEHHAIRNSVVTGVARFGRPLSISEIARGVRLAESRTRIIVEELERRLFFLVRNADGDVAWAFPVTAERTPHALECSTGERIFGACAEDAFAAAYTLGNLRRRPLRVEIRSVCGQSGRPLRLTVASDLSWRPKTHGANPLLFVPSVNWETFRGPNIIDQY